MQGERHFSSYVVCALLGRIKKERGNGKVKKGRGKNERVREKRGKKKLK